MLNFDESRYVGIQRGAVGLAERIHAAVSDALAAGVENVHFVGAGGAGILMQPAAALLQNRSTFPTFIDMPAELVVRGAAHLGPRSLVVMPSLSGTTAESVEALDYCHEKGARVMALTGHADTPLADGADVSLVNHAADDTSCESFYLQSLLVALSIMDRRGELADGEYRRVVGELQTMPELLLEAKRTFEPRARTFAEQVQHESYHIITGAGSAWPEAFYYGMCILEEMQWIRTRPVHASDFFHGTLELVEPGVSVILLKGEDASRPLAERVEKFAPQYTDKVWVLDTADVDLPGVSPDVRALVSPAVLAALLERVSAHLEVLRDHPLTTRRYYKRVAY
ncbi:MAG TPA: SIS domain-containing protein [Angustibacter sp.]|nr:SIS domain-containing protein [Angustibacter sp.]